MSRMCLLEFFLLIDNLDTMLEIRLAILTSRGEMAIHLHLVRCSEGPVDSASTRRRMADNWGYWR